MTAAPAEREGKSWRLLSSVSGAAQFAGEDNEHRLWLERWWAQRDAPYALHIGMNPSMAGADRDDLTIRKDQEFTKRLGLSRMFKCNVGTRISTDPNGLLERGIVVNHPDNVETILRLAEFASCIVVATGRPPDPLIAHARTVLKALRARGLKLRCFGLTQDHWPKHSSRLVGVCNADFGFGVVMNPLAHAADAGHGE